MKIKNIIFVICFIIVTTVPACHSEAKKVPISAETNDIVPLSESWVKKLEYAKNISIKIDEKNPAFYDVIKKRGAKISDKDAVYQQTVHEKIELLKKENSFRLEKPLLIKNPYGTSLFSVNVYFDTDEASYLEYKVSVADGSCKDFYGNQKKRIGTGLTKRHGYQLIGFVPGKENKLTLTMYNAKKKKIASHSFFITMKESPSSAEVKLKTRTTDNIGSLTEGLFCVMYGRTAVFSPNIYLYDNYGILRAEIPIEGYRTDRLLFAKHDIIYSYDKNKILRVNRMGQIIGNYIFRGYVLHHDFLYDDENNKLLMLATKSGSSSIEDILLQLDLKTGKTSELIDFKDILPQIYQAARIPSNKKTLDWLHVNTIQLVNQEIIISSRELSSIIKISNIYENPNIHSILSDKNIWNGTSYKKAVYDKAGRFTAQAGQHTVTVAKNRKLKEGQYYLYMFNNNLAYSGTRPDISWTAYKLAKRPKEKKKSYYYRYLVDEKRRIFHLAKRFPVPYSGYVSSAQELNGNIIMCSGSAFVFGEYNKDGELLKQFKFQREKHIYRVFKYQNLEVR